MRHSLPLDFLSLPGTRPSQPGVSLPCCAISSQSSEPNDSKSQPLPRRELSQILQNTRAALRVCPRICVTGFSFCRSCVLPHRSLHAFCLRILRPASDAQRVCVKPRCCILPRHFCLPTLRVCVLPPNIARLPHLRLLAERLITASVTYTEHCHEREDVGNGVGKAWWSIDAQELSIQHF